MFRRLLRIVMWLLLALLLILAFGLVRNWDTVQRVFLGGLKVYETTPPPLPADLKRPAVLVFSKTNGFRHEEAIPPGKAMFAAMAREKGWGHFETENAAVFNPEMLARFDLVVFNNTSGDVFTPDQRQAFRTWLEGGGGFLGLHAAGDDSHKGWPWYQDELIGARFTQHTMAPQFQIATVNLEGAAHAAMAGLPSSWKHTEEWYSFDRSPRKGGATVLATVDEKTYKPVGMFDKDLRMGDHPAVWSRCMAKGRVLYTIFGHRAEAFAEAETRTLLTNSAVWAAGQSGSECGRTPPKDSGAGEKAK